MQPLQAPLSVLINGDCYPLSANITLPDFSLPAILTLTSEDSGTQAAPITWTGNPDADQPPARLLAGAPIMADLWKPSTWRAGVFEVDLGATGLDVAKYGYGSLRAGGLGDCKQTIMELFWNSSAMTIARYPSVLANGTWQWLNIDKVEDKESAFAINGTAGQRALTWSKAPAAWLHGYWSFDWADSYVQIANITANIPTAGYTELTIAAATIPVYGFSTISSPIQNPLSQVL